MSCDHSHYKNGQHMSSRRALRALKAGEIKGFSKMIDKCSKCGANIRYARIVHVVYHGQ